MGNKTSSNYFYSNSSSEGVISEHLEVLSTCINRDTIKKNKTNGQLFGLVEKDEDAITFALSQLNIIIKNTNALTALRVILKNDATFTKTKTGKHYMQDLLNCLHYEDIEVQIAAGTVLGTLCDPQYSELDKTAMSTTLNGVFKEGTCKEAQYFRMRLGCYGFVYQFILFVLQIRVDIQLLGLQCLAGLCLHPLNRITVGINLGLQPLVVHILSSRPKIRAYTLLAMARLSYQPLFADFVNHDKLIVVPESAEYFHPYPVWIDQVPHEMIPAVKAMLGEYFDDVQRLDPSLKEMGEDGNNNDEDRGKKDKNKDEEDEEEQSRVEDLLINENAVYFIKNGCITSLLTLLLRSMRDVIVAEEDRMIDESSKEAPKTHGDNEATLLTEQTSIAAICALNEFAKQSQEARRRIATEKIVLRLRDDQPNFETKRSAGRKTLHDISGIGLHILLFFTTMAVSKYLRRVATELIIELAREEQNVIMFRNEIDLTDELMTLVRKFTKKDKIEEEIKKHRNESALMGEDGVMDTFNRSNGIDADFGDSLSGVVIVYLATRDYDLEVRSNAIVAFLELSIDGHTMDEIIVNHAIQPVVDVALSSFANNVLKRRCAWALSSIGLRYAGMSNDMLGEGNSIESALNVLEQFLSPDNDHVTQREATKGIAAFALIEHAVNFIINRGTLIPKLIILLESSLQNVQMYTDTLFMAVRALSNLAMYKKGREMLLIHIKAVGYSTLESYFGRMIEEHWDVSKDIAYNITRKIEIKKDTLTEQGRKKLQAFGNLNEDAIKKQKEITEARIEELDRLLKDMDSEKIAKETRDWHIKHRATATLIPEEIQSECILAIGCIMRSDRLTVYKSKWVDYFVHSAKSSNPHVASKGLAALANVASYGLSQFRLIEHTDDYCEKSILAPFKGGIEHVAINRGLNVLPILTELVRVTTTTLAPRREASKVFASLSSSPDGLLCWFQLNPKDENLMFVDYSGNALSTVRGDPSKAVDDFNWLDFGGNGIGNPESDLSAMLIQNQKKRLLNNANNEDYNFGIQFDRGDGIFIHEIDNAVNSIVQTEKILNAIEKGEVKKDDKSLKFNFDSPGPSLSLSREGFKSEWTLSVWIYIARKDDETYTPGSVNTLIDEDGIINGNYATICESSKGHQLLVIKVYDVEENAPRELKGRPIDGLSPIKRDEALEEAKEDLRLAKARALMAKKALKKRGDGNQAELRVALENVEFAQAAVEELQKSVRHVTHKIGAFDPNTKEWKMCQFDLQYLPHGWHHIVAMSTNESVYFYIDARYPPIGHIDNFNTDKSDISCIGNDIKLQHPAGLISDFRCYGFLLPPLIVHGIKAGRHAFNGARPNGDYGLYQDPVEQQKRNESGENILKAGRRHSFMMPKVKSHKKLLNDIDRDGTQDDLWVDLPTDYVSYHIGSSVEGAIPALIGALHSKSIQVIRPAARALANLALVPQNRPKIVAAGGLVPLVLLTNNPNRIIAFESSRALLHLR